MDGCRRIGRRRQCAAPGDRREAVACACRRRSTPTAAGERLKTPAGSRPALRRQGDASSPSRPARAGTRPALAPWLRAVDRPRLAGRVRPPAAIWARAARSRSWACWARSSRQAQFVITGVLGPALQRPRPQRTHCCEPFFFPFSAPQGPAHGCRRRRRPHRRRREHPAGARRRRHHTAALRLKSSPPVPGAGSVAPSSSSSRCDRLPHHSLGSRPASRKIRIAARSRGSISPMNPKRAWSGGRSSLPSIRPARAGANRARWPGSPRRSAIAESLDEVYRDKLAARHQPARPRRSAPSRRLVRRQDEHEVTEYLVGEKIMKRFVGFGQPTRRRSAPARPMSTITWTMWAISSSAGAGLRATISRSPTSAPPRISRRSIISVTCPGTSTSRPRNGMRG